MLLRLEDFLPNLQIKNRGFKVGGLDSEGSHMEMKEYINFY